MYEIFLQKFNERVPLTEQEEGIIKQHLTPKKLRKRQYLLQEGDICKSIWGEKNRQTGTLVIS